MYWVGLARSSSITTAPQPPGSSLSEPEMHFCTKSASSPTNSSSRSVTVNDAPFDCTVVSSASCSSEPETYARPATGSTENGMPPICSGRICLPDVRHAPGTEAVIVSTAYSL